MAFCFFYFFDALFRLLRCYFRVYFAPSKKTHSIAPKKSKKKSQNYFKYLLLFAFDVIKIGNFLLLVLLKIWKLKKIKINKTRTHKQLYAKFKALGLKDPVDWALQLLAIGTQNGLGVESERHWMEIMMKMTMTMTRRLGDRVGDSELATTFE